MWYEKLICIVNRRIVDLKELKKLEAEKAAKFSNVEERTLYIIKQRLADPEDLYLSSSLGFND